LMYRLATCLARVANDRQGLLNLAQPVGPVGFQELRQQVHLQADFTAPLRVADSTRRVPLADHFNGRDDVDAVTHRRLYRLEVMMFGKESSLGLNHQSVAMIAVGFGEGAVNRDRLAAFLERRFALVDLYRHMAIDDEAAYWVSA